MSRIHEYLALGVQFHQQGNLAEAEKFYRRVLAVAPDQTDALHLMGVIQTQNGHPAQAVRLIDKAISNNPIVAMFHNSLGIALKDQGKQEEAAESFRRALKLDHHLAEAHFNLASILKGQSHSEEAEKHALLAHQVKPQSAEICNLLASLKLSKKDFNQAIHYAEMALHLKVNDPEAMQHMGAALFHLGRTDEALHWYRKAISSLPDDPALLNNLATLHCERGYLDQAMEYAEAAIARKPDLSEAWNTLGNIRKEMGQVDLAYKYYKKAVESNPSNPSYLSNSIYTLLFSDQDVHELLQKDTRDWNGSFGSPEATSFSPYLNNRDPQRRLRIGYVSADFRSHPVGRFILPLLEHHDRDQFEIFAYNSVQRADGLTHRTKKACDWWRESSGLTPLELAAKVRGDRIDILVDLSMHLGNNRLETFALKPAPIQVSYLAYPGKTGLPSIDYHFTDRFQDPLVSHGPATPDYPVSLGDSWVCYQPINETPMVSELPALQKGYLTFGCLNNFCKVTPGVLKLWTRILMGVPNSRLVILSGQGSHRDRLRLDFREYQIAPERIEFVERMGIDDYFQKLGQFDLCLDTFPYPGIRTTMDSLWMGVPVVSLAGNSELGRAGIGPLSLTGLDQFVAKNGNGYVEIAIKAGKDLDRLVRIRQGLRPAMLQSPLMDAAGFARKVEDSFRNMWRKWCENR